MIRLSKDSVVDTESYGERLNHDGFILYDREEAQYMLSYLDSRAVTLADRASFIMKLNSACMYYNLDKNVIFNYLVNCEHCPERYFYTGRTQSFSLDKKRVLEKLVSNGKAVEFLTLYMEYRSLQSKHNSLKTIVGNCKEPITKDRDGKELCKINFFASQQKNLRFNYRQYDIISQIPKEVCDIISAEDGYFLVWGDFAQSDFRVAYNLFLRSEENDRIMNQYTDKYEALARIVKKSLGQEFNLEEFKQERPIYKRLTLATMYGTRTSQIKEENDFIQTFVAFLNKCPKYTEYYRRLQEHLIMKSPIELHSYFGHSEFISYTYDKQSVVNDALNSPVQTGTSELVIMTVNSIMNMAESLGLTEDQFSVYMVRHDEPIFRVREDALPFVWILQQHNQILVDDWTPLLMEFNYGYRYHRVDEELQKKAEEVYLQNANKITELKSGCVIDTEFYPVKPLLNLSVYWMSVYDKTIITFCEQRTKKVMFSLLDTTDRDEIIRFMRLRLSDSAEKIQEQYQGVFVANGFYDAEDFFKETHVIYSFSASYDTSYAERWCKHMAYLYCTKNGLDVVDGAVKLNESLPDQLDVLVLDE